jgi:DNA-binding HxlR family transcriptional regulator
MAETRTYATQQHCPVARTLDALGDRWTMLILRDLSWGRMKFSALLESLEGISPNVLSERLKKLEQIGMVNRAFYSDHPPRAEYKLSQKGQGFVPVLIAMRVFGEQWEPERRNARRA